MAQIAKLHRHAPMAQQSLHNAWLKKFSKETTEDLSHFHINVRPGYAKADFLSTLDVAAGAALPSWSN